mgnify:CR=1 FL=1
MQTANEKAAEIVKKALEQARGDIIDAMIRDKTLDARLKLLDELDALPHLERRVTVLTSEILNNE